MSYNSTITSNHIIIFFNFLPGWVKLGSLTVPSAGKHVEQLEFSNTAGESVNCYNHFGNSLAISIKTEHMHIL